MSERSELAEKTVCALGRRRAVDIHEHERSCGGVIFHISLEPLISHRDDTCSVCG
jgi:hypothetical protein